MPRVRPSDGGRLHAPIRAVSECAELQVAQATLSGEITTGLLEGSASASASVSEAPAEAVTPCATVTHDDNGTDMATASDETLAAPSEAPSGIPLLEQSAETTGAPAADHFDDFAERRENACAEATTEHETVTSLLVDSVQTEERPPEGPGVLNFYGVIEQPFDVTPDPAYLYLSQVHREALASLSDGIQNLRGFMALVAEPGMGKTTLLNKLTEELRDSARVVFLFQTQCNSRELLCYLLNELAVDYTGMDVVAMHRALNETLLHEMYEGRRFVLIVDEAQNLDSSVLESIRLLSDFETSHSKLIQIVLAGQPQLAHTLMLPELSQLRQRVSVLASLEPLSASETARYVEHRLRAAGSSGEPIFTPEALALIAERSHGTPREINNLCFNALRLGRAERSRIIGKEIIQKVAAKSDLESIARRQPLAGSPRSTPLAVAASAPKTRTSVALTGRVTEKLRSRTWESRSEYRILVALERESALEIPVADRHYCASFYLDGEHATQFLADRPIRITIEQD